MTPSTGSWTEIEHLYARKQPDKRAQQSAFPTVSGGQQHTKPVSFKADLFEQMVRHIQSTAPVEGCGLVAFDDDRPVKIYPGTNTLDSTTRYRMDDREVLIAVDEMDRNGWWLGAIYHSHPNSPPVPSSTDLREANWPDALMIIISLQSGQPQARAYRVERQHYQEIPLLIEPPAQGLLPSLRVLARYAVRAVTEPESTLDDHPRPARQAAAGGFPQAAPVLPADHAPVVEDLPSRATIGILGGMGPLATVDLMGKIVQATPASRDQEHIPVVVVSDPRVPDRTAALLEGGDDPVPWLVRGARLLESMEANFIIIPCNTAHAFLEQVQPHIRTPILSMIGAASDAIYREFPGIRRVGLLATSGTIQSGIYQEALRSHGITTLIPTLDTQQNMVMQAIQQVKAGSTATETRDLLARAGRELVDDGAEVLLAACTEIPVVLTPDSVPVPLVDATDVLARQAVSLALEIDAGVAQNRTAL